MKRILLIGGNGQVSTYVQRALNNAQRLSELKVELQVASRDQLDLMHLDSIAATLEEMAPDIIINPAAYTAVDLAESEQEAAFTINRDAVAEIAAYCARKGVILIHFSTDYVFAGDASSPYLESDATAPTGVYGQSKLAGENAIIASGAQAIILRTAWVYSNHGKNFYKTMLGLAQSRNELSVVADQIGAPTFAGSIADAVQKLVRIIVEQDRLAPEQTGIFHFTCQGQTSWAAFAKAIFVENEITSIKVNSISTQEYPTPAARPAYSVLNLDKLNKVFGISLPHWGTALAHCVAEDQLKV